MFAAQVMLHIWPTYSTQLWTGWLPILRVVVWLAGRSSYRQVTQYVHTHWADRSVMLSCVLHMRGCTHKLILNLNGADSLTQISKFIKHVSADGLSIQHDIWCFGVLQ